MKTLHTTPIMQAFDIFQAWAQSNPIFAMVAMALVVWAVTYKLKDFI